MRADISSAKVIEELSEKLIERWAHERLNETQTEVCATLRSYRVTSEKLPCARARAFAGAFTLTVSDDTCHRACPCPDSNRGRIVARDRQRFAQRLCRDLRRFWEYTVAPPVCAANSCMRRSADSGTLALS